MSEHTAAPPGSRSAARQLALGILYQADLLGQPIEAVLDRHLREPEVEHPEPYTVDLVSGVGRLREQLDERISAAAEHWTLERMPLVDRNVLRLACYELLAHPEVPAPVILDEAVKLAKLLSTGDSGRFVNGVLGTVARQLRG